MVRYFAIAVLMAAALPGADKWTEYRSGPFHVFSNAGDKAARDKLTELEQLRYVLGSSFGKTDLPATWPVNLVVFAGQKEYAPYILPHPVVDGGSATLAAWYGEAPLPHDILREITRRLIDDNMGRMPEAMETAVEDLFSTIQVNATRVSLGAPLSSGELSGARLRNWAKLQMLATQPEFSGKLRVYLSNYQAGGDESSAARNAFELTPAALDARVEAYVRAGVFSAAPVNGRALNPNREYIEKLVPEPVMAELLAELKDGGKTPPPDSPRGLMAKGTRPALELAAAANPRWAVPHFLLGGMETTSAGEIKELQTATKLDPRNASYWKALAEMQAFTEQYAAADKSWNAAEHAAATEDERSRIHQARLTMDEKRSDFETAQRKRMVDDRTKELNGIKASSLAAVHAAEEAANKSAGGLTSNQTPVQWWKDEEGVNVTGTLTTVDCLTGSLRLTVKPATGTAVRLMIRDPNKLAVKGAATAEFACGAQKPARKISVFHNGKADAAQGTSGDITTVEFP